MKNCKHSDLFCFNFSLETLSFVIEVIEVDHLKSRNTTTIAAKIESAFPFLNTKFKVQNSTTAHDMKRTKVAYSISPLANGGSLINFPSQPPTSLPPPVSPVTPPTLTISDE